MLFPGKLISKQLYMANNCRTPKIIPAESGSIECPSWFRFPVILKPRFQVASFTSAHYYICWNTVVLLGFPGPGQHRLWARKYT
jgi:hypothetical protein